MLFLRCHPFFLETATPTGRELTMEHTLAGQQALGTRQALSLRSRGFEEYTAILGFLHSVLVALSVAGNEM